MSLTPKLGYQRGTLLQTQSVQQCAREGSPTGYRPMKTMAPHRWLMIHQTQWVHAASATHDSNENILRAKKGATLTTSAASQTNPLVLMVGVKLGVLSQTADRHKEG